MSSATSLNLFVATSDPRRYLPRPATEAALAALEQRLHDGHLATLLVGARGVGKSLLLRVLAHRLRRAFRVALVPPLGFAAHELCAWVLEELRVPRGDDPELAIACAAADWKRRGSALVVAIDDLHDLAPGTASRLAGLALAADGGLRFLGAARETLAPGHHGFGPEAGAVELSEGMSFADTGVFVRAALSAGCAQPELRAFFDAATILRLRRESHGIPGEVNHLAAQWLAAAVHDGVLPEPGRPAWRACSPKNATSA